MKKLKLGGMTFLIGIAAAASFAQSKPVVTVPKAEDIARITIEPSEPDLRIYNRRSLLATLPRLIPGFEQFYLSDTTGQEGTFIMKDGTILEWVAVDNRSLMIISARSSRLFFVAGEDIDKRLTIPRVEDISRVSISMSRKNIYSRASLLKLIPKLVPARIYNIVPIKQRGTITLRDGTVLNWASGDNEQLVLFYGKNKILYGTDSRRELTLPKPEDVEEISFDSSDAEWFTSETMLKILPQLKRGGGHEPNAVYQYGNITLKDTTVLNWRAKDGNSLILYNRSGETYFKLPTKIWPKR